MNRQIALRLLTGLIIGSVALYATAEVYTWKDSSGKIVYSDQPPPGVNATPMRVKASKPSSTPARKADEKKGASEPAAEVAQGNKVTEYNAKVKAENCKNARANLQKLQAGLRIANPDGKGGKNFPTDKERADMLRQTQKDVDTWCK